MRIAIPIWGDIISPVLDTASRLLVVEIQERDEVSRFEIHLDEEELSRRCFRIQRTQIDIIICGAISYPFVRMLTASGVNVIAEISGQVEEVLKAYLEGELFHPRFFMPGCKCKKLWRQKEKESAASK